MVVEAFVPCHSRRGYDGCGTVFDPWLSGEGGQGSPSVGKFGGDWESVGEIDEHLVDQFAGRTVSCGSLFDEQPGGVRFDVDGQSDSFALRRTSRSWHYL